jgi:hypothetical protein
VSTTDYRCEARGEKLASEEVKLVPFDRSRISPSENPDHHPKKNEPFNKEMNLKIWFQAGI